MINYDWNCKTVDVRPLESGESDVVYNVHWIVTGTSDKLNAEGVYYSVTNIGTQLVSWNPQGEFIPFEDLTNEIVVGWTQSSMEDGQVASIESSISREIENLINPKSITLTVGDPVPSVE